MALHALQDLLGNLDRSYLTRLPAAGGLQSYPSRTKDPDQVDFSTGSVGLGAAASLFAAVARRYVDAHFGARPASRFVALLGDAELDEGNVWEAVAGPATQGLGNVMWVVDFNRQSLDRVVPGIRIQQESLQFRAADWHVLEVKYGPRLREAYARPDGERLEAWIDAMPNERYQSLFGLSPSALRERFLDGTPTAVREFCSSYDDEELAALVTDLGGHDLGAMLDGYRQCDTVTDRPSVVFAYTIQGWGLAIAGNPRNHFALLTGPQIDELRARAGLSLETEWDRIDPTTAAGQWARVRAEHLVRLPATPRTACAVPTGTGWWTPAAPPRLRWCRSPRRARCCPRRWPLRRSLEDEVVHAHVVDVTSLDRLYAAGRGRCARASAPPRHLPSRERCGRRST